jgi:hypothetical protein
MSYTQFVTVGILLQKSKAKSHLKPSRYPVKTTDVMYNTNINDDMGNLSFVGFAMQPRTPTHTRSFHTAEGLCVLLVEVTSMRRETMK